MDLIIIIIIIINNNIYQKNYTCVIDDITLPTLPLKTRNIVVMLERNAKGRKSQVMYYYYYYYYCCY